MKIKVYSIFFLVIRLVSRISIFNEIISNMSIKRYLQSILQ
jgi:hypothetical protein